LNNEDSNILKEWDAQFYDKSFGFIAEYGSELVELLNPQAGERVVDLGCGVGQLTARIKASGCDVIGIDADPAMVLIAQKKYPNIEFSCAMAEEFSLSDPVNACFSNAFLHWSLQPEKVISNIAKNLISGGRFVGEMGGHKNVITITESLYEALAEESVARNRVNFPWFFPEKDYYISLLEEGGFRVTEAQYFVRPTPLDNCANGIRDWIQMFATNFLEVVPENRVSEFLRRTEDLCRDKLYIDGRWIADYTRLRFHAERI